MNFIFYQKNYFLNLNLTFEFIQMLGELKGEYKKIPLFLVLFSFTIKGKYNLMSILVEKITNNGSTSTSQGSYPPGDVIMINKYPENGSIHIQWQDPADTIANDIKLSEWSHTILVRKTDSYPTSPSDGDVVIDNYERDKYKDTEYIDSDLDTDVTYYYRFFTYNTDGECNNSTNMMFNIVNVLADYTLSNNDWQVIIDIANQGKAQNYWNIGDEISLTLGSPYSVTVVLQIWDFDHFNIASDSSKTANICFGLKDCYFEEKFNTQSGLTATWPSTYLYKRMTTIYNSIPTIVRSNIKEVAVPTCSCATGNVHIGPQKVFIPSDSEIGDNEYDPEEGFLLPIFKDGHVCGLYNKTGSPKYIEEEQYWLRSRSNSSYYKNDVCLTFGDGSGVFFGSADFNEYGVRFCFNI